jgi:hypothetical protein
MNLPAFPYWNYISGCAALSNIKRWLVGGNKDDSPGIARIVQDEVLAAGQEKPGVG